MPGRQPAHRYDREHTLDYALGGETSTCNLACLCKRHHTLKGETAWTVRQLGGGILEWTSPGGHEPISLPRSVAESAGAGDTEDRPYLKEVANKNMEAN